MNGLLPNKPWNTAISLNFMMLKMNQFLKAQFSISERKDSQRKITNRVYMPILKSGKQEKSKFILKGIQEEKEGKW